LGCRISGLGLRVQLSHYVVPCVLGVAAFRQQWNREVRWMRNARVSRPIEVPIVPIVFSTPVTVDFALVTGFSRETLAPLPEAGEQPDAAGPG
jgi:hypothetical protein